LIFLITTREEVGGLGAAEIDPAIYRHADLAIAIDHTGEQGTIIYEAPQLTRIDITVHGKKSHAGMHPEEGANAIQAFCKAVSEFHLGRLDADTTANVGTVQAEGAHNIVPDKVTSVAEVRGYNVQRIESELEHMEQSLKNVTQHVCGTHYEMKNTVMVAHYKTSLEEESVQPVLNAFKALGLPCLPFEPKAPAM
jgi:tripeptide aminopeptidase